MNADFLKHTLDGGEALNDDWQLVFDSIERMKAYCGDHNIAFLLTIYPYGHQVSEQEWLPGRFALVPGDATVSDKCIEVIEAQARKAGIELVNTVPAFRAHHPPPLLYFHHDLHWTPAGHRVMAESLVPSILRRFRR